MKYLKTFMGRAANVYADFKQDIAVWSMLALIFSAGFAFGAIVIWIA